MRYTLALALFLCPAVFAQSLPVAGTIEFFGARRTSVADLRKALGVVEGGPLPSSKGDAEDRLQALKGVVQARLEAVCCEDGKAILYVGIEERGAPTFQYRDPPEQTVELPEGVAEAYARYVPAVREAGRAGLTQEDLSQGHSIMSDPTVRAIQNEFIGYADLHLNAVKKALREAADEDVRAAAVVVLGYAPNKVRVIDDLLYALQDPSDSVRSNALRALAAIAVLARAQPRLELKIPSTWIVELLHSIIFSDRLQAARTLVTLTETRDAALLGAIREQALADVVEMAAWRHLPHALPAYILLGRILAMPEEEIQQTWSAGQRKAVLDRARKMLK